MASTTLSMAAFICSWLLLMVLYVLLFSLITSVAVKGKSTGGKAHLQTKDGKQRVDGLLMLAHSQRNGIVLYFQRVCIVGFQRHIRFVRRIEKAPGFLRYRVLYRAEALSRYDDALSP